MANASITIAISSIALTIKLTVGTTLRFSKDSVIKHVSSNIVVDYPYTVSIWIS